MGCGLRKLEDPDDSSPGKIFATLKRPQVETKTDSAYEYLLLDFTLEAIPNPEVIKISSLCEIPSKVEDYYRKGYVLGAIHPVVLSIGRRKHLPVSYLYRMVLSRHKLSSPLESHKSIAKVYAVLFVSEFRPRKLSQKNTTPRGHRHPRLSIEEWPVIYESLTSECVKGLIEKVNEVSKRGRKFVGFLTQHTSQSKPCNGTSSTNTEGPCEALCKRNPEQRKEDLDENYKNWTMGTLSGHSSESGIEEESQEETGSLPEAVPQFGREGSPFKSQKGEDKKLYAVFNVYEDDTTDWSYQEGRLSMKVTRKGPTICNLEADWLELTTFHYKQGLSLIDSFVLWEPQAGDYLSKTVDGLFIFEEEGCGVPGVNRKGNDAIIVEQWTVIEGCEVKTDYGPLLHTLAEFGWLLTCVLPTPIMRHDSEGNLATKQVVFLQRPALFNATVPNTERKSAKCTGGEEKVKVLNRNIGLNTVSCRAPESPSSNEFHMAPSKQCWDREDSTQYGNLSGFNTSDSVLRDLDDGQFEQEDGGVTQVTCM